MVDRVKSCRVDRGADGYLERHWRKKPLAKRLGVSPATLDRWRRRGQFPPGIRLTDQVVIWSEREVADWLRRRSSGA